MAWFKSNKVETRIANILKGTSDPASSIGDNGQLYLKYANLSLREYIEVGSTAGPYINTGFYWSSDCEFEIKAKWTGTPANNTAFFGAYSPNQDTDVQVYNGNTLFYVGGGGTASLSIDTNDHIYKATQSELLLDGTNVSTPNWSRVPTSLEVSIFTMQQHSPAINARIYYIKIWKNGELHKYFIPAINNETNEIGMFEAVSGEFYSNDGTGNFDISPTVISDMPSQPILSSFAKVNGQWQDLIGTNIDDILAGGSKYIKATGSFTSASSGGQKVEVNCGFKPDLVMVDMEFGNGFTRATYLSTAWYEETDHPSSVWDLRPMENVIYAITPGSVSGETGITDLTDTGFKYRSNGSNTTNKACTYTAIKFDAEEQTDPIVLKNYAKFDGSQGIILPWKLNADYKVEVTFYQTEYVQAENIIGNTVGASYSHLTPYQGGYWSSLGSDEGFIPNLSWSAGEHTYITNNGNNHNEFDGVEVQAYTPTTKDGYYTIGIRANTSIIRSYIKSYKIYSISQGTLLHELVPCLYDGTVTCLYDKVGKMFFYNGIEAVMDTIPTT